MVGIARNMAYATRPVYVRCVVCGKITAGRNCIEVHPAAMDTITIVAVTAKQMETAMSPGCIL